MSGWSVVTLVSFRGHQQASRVEQLQDVASGLIGVRVTGTPAGCRDSWVRVEHHVPVNCIEEPLVIDDSPATG